MTIEADIITADALRSILDFWGDDSAAKVIDTRDTFVLSAHKFDALWISIRLRNVALSSTITALDLVSLGRDAYEGYEWSQRNEIHRHREDRPLWLGTRLAKAVSRLRLVRKS